MAEVASAYVSLIPSARGFASGIQKEVGTAADRAGRDAGRRIGGSLKSAIASAAIGTAAFGFLKSSISEASDLNETLSKTEVILGKQGAAAADRFARSAASLFGQSRVQALDAISTFATFGKSAGLGGKALASFSTDFAGLASDLASFHNTSPEEAITAIGAALRGEAEPIRRYGVLLDDASLRQEALRQGLVKTTKEALTPQQKVLAAQALIYKQTSDAQGDFARTSGGLANQQRILSARTDDLKASLGKGLLPVMTDVVTEVSDFVAEMQNGTGAGGEFVDILKDARDVGKGVLDFFESIPGPVKKYGIQLAIAAIALNKVNNGLVAGRARMTGWVDSLGPAGAQMSRTTKASYALGVGLRNLAGAGGMIALTKSAGNADTAVGALGVTAGAALTGFAVGGPIGAAIGAGAGGLFSLYRALNKGKEEAKVSLPTFKEYASTLDGVAASTTRATREMVFQRLEQSGLLAATRELGLTDRQAVAAMMGNATQRKNLSNLLRNQNTLTKEQEAALRKETGALGSSREAQLRKNIALAQNKEELKKARQALRDFMKEPASKRVSIVGVEDAKGQLNSLRTAIQQVFAASRDLNNVGPGGIDVLLNPEKREHGGPVVAGQPYIVGERRPELFVPDQNGRIISKVPTPGVGSGVGLGRVDTEQSTYRAVARALADTRTVIMSKDNLSDLDLLVGTA